MKISTKQFGEIEVKDEEIINFQNPIYGFASLKKFILIRHGLLGWLQSVENPDIAFLVANPYEVYKDYDVELDDKDAEKLEINTTDDVFLLSIITLPEKTENISMNLLSPVVINYKNYKASQIILNNPKYKTKHYFYKELQAFTAKKEKKTEEVAVS